MTDKTVTTSEIDYKLEISREIKRTLRFLIKELELIQEKSHVDDILGEIIYITSTVKDTKTKAYASRKLREIALEYPEFFNKKEMQ